MSRRSSSVASKRVHHGTGERGRPRGGEVRRAVRKMAATARVDCGYRAGTGVWSLSEGGGLVRRGEEDGKKGREDGHVVDVAPAATDDVLVVDEFEDAEVVDQVAVREARLGLEAEAFEDLHLGDDEGVLAVVELGGKVVHRDVEAGEGGRGGEGGGGAVVDEGEEVGVGVYEVADAEGGFFELGGEEEGAEADVLGAGCECMRRAEMGRERRTRTPKCLSEVTNQKRWNKTWAVAITTWGLGVAWSAPPSPSLPPLSKKRTR